LLTSVQFKLINGAIAHKVSSESFGFIHSSMVHVKFEPFYNKILSWAQTKLHIS